MISERGRKALRLVVERAAAVKEISPSNLLARLPNCGAKTLVELLAWLELPDTDGWVKRLEGMGRRIERKKKRAK